jgi:hypothetical protein
MSIWADGDKRPEPRDDDANVFGPAAPAQDDAVVGAAAPAQDDAMVGSAAPAHDGADQPARSTPGRERSISRWAGITLLAASGIAAVVLVLSSAGAISLPGSSHSADGAQTTAESAASSKLLAADEQWASATCTTVLNWENEIKRDESGLSFSLGSLSKIEDAISATTGMVNELGKLGLPPSAHAAQAQADLERLRSDLEARAHDITSAASGILSGNFSGIGKLISELENYKSLGTAITNDLTQVVSVDLGLSLAETQSCRQLVGIQTSSA